MRPDDEEFSFDDYRRNDGSIDVLAAFNDIEPSQVAGRDLELIRFGIVSVETIAPVKSAEVASTVIATITAISGVHKAIRTINEKLQTSFENVGSDMDTLMSKIERLESEISELQIDLRNMESRLDA